MTVEIRNENPADERAIELVVIAAFENAPRSRHVEQHMVSGLRRHGQLTLSLVAEEAGVVVGHVAISPVTISDGSPSWFGLGPLSVHPDHQRRGIGSHLTLEALRLLLERGAAGCVVLGDPAYYGRFGFRANSSLVLPNVSPEYFQALPFGASTPGGTVTYDSAFNVPD